MKSHDDSIFASLERELRSLQPLPPDPDFLGKLERKMQNGPASAPVGNNIVSMPMDNRGNAKPWLAVAACAVVATGAVAWKHQQLTAEQNSLAGGASGPNQFVPQAVSSQFQRVHAGDLIMDPQRGPMRKVRFEFNNTQQFIDQRNGSRMEFRYPSQQEILVAEPMD